ncbi:hypothetical protein HDU76_005962 [Blyttiomyces sp. JEL0837]|nr:hypothetical protein HDU76_005962 [Blyttiomyces sp. JEL0837]
MNLLAVLTSLTTLVGVIHTSQAAPTGTCEPVTVPWTPNVDFIDTSNFYSQNKPAGGWYVTPIHATLLKTGQIFIVGWGRRDYSNCVKPDGTRKHGVSFVINQSDIVAAGNGPIPAAGRNPTFIIPTPIADLRQGPEDTLYCSGQVTLPDGRVFLVGGASYQNLGTPSETEYGVSYARIYNPDTGAYSLTPQSPIGTMWYPTAAQLTNGDILVTGGFAKCCAGDPDANDQVAVYHPSTNSWTRLGTVNDHLISPGIRDYTHVWALAQPLNINGITRQVAMMGYKGTIIFYNTDPNTPESQRYVTATNGDRGANAGNNGAWDSTAFYSPTGELVTVGGGNSPWKVDMYSLTSKTWRSYDIRVSRDNAISILLPDGTVLLLGGKNRFDNNFIPYPQILDPVTGVATDLPAWSNDNNIRAYHSWGILLKDGRVLVGGGIDNNGHDIACERIDMRVFTPPYLRPNGASCVTRPVINAPTPSGTPITFTIRRDGTANPETIVSFSGANLKSTNGASLMAFGSFTHAFDQHQRYFALNVRVVTAPSGTSAGSVGLSLVAGQIPLEGLYNLFLIGADGVPSVGVLAKIVAV